VYLRKPVIFSTSVLSVAHCILLLNYHFDAARPIASTSVVVSLAFLKYSQSLVSPPLFRASTLDEISRILCATEVALGFSGWNHLAWRGSNLKTPGLFCATLRSWTLATLLLMASCSGVSLEGWCRIYFAVIHAFCSRVRMSCCDGGQFQICLPLQITLPLAHDGLHMLYDCWTGLCRV